MKDGYKRSMFAGKYICCKTKPELGLTRSWHIPNRWNWFLSFKVFGRLASSLLLYFTMFRLICPPTFFGCVSNSGAYTEFRTASIYLIHGICFFLFIPLTITGYKCLEFLYSYSPAVRIGPPCWLPSSTNAWIRSENISAETLWI